MRLQPTASPSARCRRARLRRAARRGRKGVKMRKGREAAHRVAGGVHEEQHHQDRVADFRCRGRHWRAASRFAPPRRASFCAGRVTRPSAAKSAWRVIVASARASTVSFSGRRRGCGRRCQICRSARCSPTTRTAEVPTKSSAQAARPGTSTYLKRWKRSTESARGRFARPTSRAARRGVNSHPSSTPRCAGRGMSDGSPAGRQARQRQRVQLA